MTQLSWSIVNWFVLVWIANPIMVFVTAFLMEKHQCKRKENGWSHLLPALVGVAVSQPAVWFTSLLQNAELTVQILACAVIAALLGNLLGWLIFRRRTK